MNEMSDILVRAVTALNKEGVKPLLIGGLAVNHHGYTRATADIDLMLALDQAGVARRAMVDAGFGDVDEHENVIFFRMPGRIIRVDLLKVEEATMKELLSRAIPIIVCGVSILVPALEDLIAMKMFALKHGGTSRADKDLPDIVQLIALNDLDLERAIKPLALRFADESIFDAVKERVTGRP